MWELETEDVPLGRRLAVRARADARLSFRRYLEALQADEAFAEWYSKALASQPFDAFFWEHPPLTAERLDATMECVVLDAPALAAAPADPTPFASQFARAGDEAVVEFANLGGDARLVVPLPGPGALAYPHLAAFLRQAPAARLHALWRLTASAVLARLSGAPLWLSTAGMGVAWLHVRLDSTPKYYRYAPYRKAPPA